MLYPAGLMIKTRLQLAEKAFGSMRKVVALVGVVLFVGVSAHSSHAQTEPMPPAMPTSLQQCTDWSRARARWIKDLNERLETCSRSTKLDERRQRNDECGWSFVGPSCYQASRDARCASKRSTSTKLSQCYAAVESAKIKPKVFVPSHIRDGVSFKNEFGGRDLFYERGGQWRVMRTLTDPSRPEFVNDQAVSFHRAAQGIFARTANGVSFYLPPDPNKVDGLEP